MDALTLHEVDVCETTEYDNVAPPKALASAVGVAGEPVVVKLVLGAHVTACGAR